MTSPMPAPSNGPCDLTTVCDRFEQAWLQNDPPRLDDHLPPAEHSQRLEALVELVLIDLRGRFGMREPTLVEGYLERFPELGSDPVPLVQLVLAEARLRRRHGEAVDLAEYERRFPHLAGFLRAHWAVAVAGRSVAADESADTIAPRGTPTYTQIEVGDHFPDFEVLSELGRGAMGVVYRARQRTLSRVVALKVIRADWAGDPEKRAMFRREAEAVAKLQHPNVVQVFAAGEWQRAPDRPPTPYLAMELVGGGSLHAKLAGKPLEPRPAAALLETLARALEAAHQRGIVHRDLKPENVLLTEDGTPKVSDFGLAKLTESNQSLLASGAVVGTPSYMAPEQALGKNRDVGPPADVWALGAVLYECLTGRPPFLGATLLETLEQVVGREPVPPRLLNAAVDRDLETITLKCLQKPISRRYARAADLAEDLRRYQAHEPILARPVGSVERGWRWCRRNPAVAALLLAVAVTLVGGTTVAASLAFYAREEAGRAEEEAGKARDSAAEAKTNEEKAVAEKKHADDERKRAETAETNAKTQLGLTREHLFTAQMQRVAGVADRYPVRGLALLRDETACPPELRDHAWGYYWNRCQVLRHHLEAFTEDVGCLAYSPDGKMIAAGSGEAFPMGQKQVNEARLFDAETGKVRATLAGHLGKVNGIAFSPDGRHVATASEDHTVRLWNAGTGRLEKSFRFAVAAGSVAFTPDGKSLLVGAGEVHRVEVATGKDEVLVKEVRYSTAFSRDGHLAATSHSPDLDDEGEIKVWDLTTGQLRWKVPWDGRQLWRLAFSPDGRYLASGGGRSDKESRRYVRGEIRVWDTADGRLVHSLIGHVDGVHGLAFAPDGKTLAAAYGNVSVSPGDVWVWGLEDGQPLLVLEGHDQRQLAVAFSPDGRRLASGGEDHVLRVWNLDAGWPRVMETKKPAWNLAVSGDGKTLAAGDETGQVTLWDAATCERKQTLEGGGQVRMVGFGKGGTVLALCGDKLITWEVASGKMTATAELKNLNDGFAFDMTAQLSPDGSTLAVSPGRGPVRLFDAATGEAVASFEPREDVAAMAWFPGGGGLALGCTKYEKTEAQVWDLPVFGAFGPRHRLEGFTAKDNFARVMATAFSPDGKLLATGDGEGNIKLWDAGFGVLLRSFRGRAQGVLSLAFTSDGKTLASSAGNLAGYRSEVKLWDVPTGQERGQVEVPTVIVTRVAFGDGDRALFASCGDGRVRAWNLTRP